MPVLVLVLPAQYTLRFAPIELAEMKSKEHSTQVHTLLPTTLSDWPVKGWRHGQKAEWNSTQPYQLWELTAGKCGLIFLWQGLLQKD